MVGKRPVLAVKTDRLDREKVHEKQSGALIDDPDKHIIVPWSHPPKSRGPAKSLTIDLRPVIDP